MDEQTEQKEALKNYMSSSIESLKHLKRGRRKKIILILFFVFFITFLIFYGPLPMVAKKQLRYYEIKLNNQELSVYETINNTTIIPGIFEKPNGVSVLFALDYREWNKVIPGKKFLFDIKSYTCYLKNENKKIPISCGSKTHHLYENNDTSYTSMQILQYPYDNKYTYSLGSDYIFGTYHVNEDHSISKRIEEYQTIYDGMYINDLTSFIQKKSVYLIKVRFKYRGTKGTISFGIVNNGKNILAI